MAQLDLREGQTDADLATLYWWRRDSAARDDTEQSARLSKRLVAVGERAAAAPRPVVLPGNRLRANAEMRRAPATPASKHAIALDRDLRAAIRHERRNALIGMAIALTATVAPLAAAIYAAIMQEPIALGFAIAGACAASVALYHAAHWFLLMRADEAPNFLV